MKHLSKVLALLVALMMVVSLVPAMAEGGDVVDILFLGTSDLHGQAYATDYTQDAGLSGQYKQGLTRVSTYVKEQRTQYANVFLGDAGDTIQGTPLTYYYAFYQGKTDDPSIKALRAMNYDMWVVGNHEFNYGMEILGRQLDYATSASTDTESQLYVSMANYLDDATNSDDARDWKTFRGYDPYRIYEYDGVKVAVMGIGNPNIANWDVPANWAGIYFANPVETYLHYEQEMDEKSDLIVIYTHSGVDGDPDSDFMRELVEKTQTIDLVFSGHEHRSEVNEITNAAGKEIPVISPSTKAKAIGRALISYNKATKEYEITPEVVDMRDYALDEDLVNVLKPYEETAWNGYMLQSIGKASGNFPAANLGTAPSAFVDLVNRVQLWGAYDNTGYNTPDDKDDDTQAMLSITAPLTSGNAEFLIPEGDIMLGDMFKLYRYENWFYQIRMTGKEVKTWLEYSASKLGYDENGALVVNGGLTYYDVISGAGFSYVIDMDKEAGSRIVSMTLNGEEIADDAALTVVVNNYRYNGGGDYIKYLNEHDCPFTPNDQDRIIYSTQYDMVQGEDMGQARNLLAEYIRQNGTVSPSISSTWQIINVK